MRDGMAGDLYIGLQRARGVVVNVSACQAEVREPYGHLDLLSLRRRIDELLDELLTTLSEH